MIRYLWYSVIIFNQPEEYYSFRTSYNFMFRNTIAGDIASYGIDIYPICNNCTKKDTIASH